MKIKSQLSIATVMFAGAFVVGCSGQQIAGDSQNTGASQNTGSSQQHADEPVVKTTPVKTTPVKTRPVKTTRPRRTAGNCHNHPANAKTKSITHCHPRAGSPSHSHSYGGRTAPRRSVAAPRRVAPQPRQQVDVRALQTKLKAKGYYKGPIDGAVSDNTRSALQQYMQNR